MTAACKTMYILPFHAINSHSRHIKITVYKNAPQCLKEFRESEIVQSCKMAGYD